MTLANIIFHNKFYMYKENFYKKIQFFITILFPFTIDFIRIK